MQTATLMKAPKSTPAATIAASVTSAVAHASLITEPFRHWRFKDILPHGTCEEIIALPIAPIAIDETHGKRDSHNEARRFFSPEMQARYPVMRAVAEAFQGASVLRSLEKLCGVKLCGGYLRIEYCQDTGSFWLEPHMDIKEKFITLQIYLNTGEGADRLGTDLYDGDKKYFSTSPSQLGDAMLFVPKEPSSWHGFEKRAIASVRRSLLINYVTDDWRSRHELSFPDEKVS
jgi:hypothetical protein